MKGQTQMQSLHIIYDTIMECLFLKHNKETLLPKHSWEILLLTGRGSRQSVCARARACLCARACMCVRVCVHVRVYARMLGWGELSRIETNMVKY